MVGNNGRGVLEKLSKYLAKEQPWTIVACAVAN